MQVNPYLNFNGHCTEAFKFSERVLGGRIESAERFGMLTDRCGIPWMVNCQGASKGAESGQPAAAGSR